MHEPITDRAKYNFTVKVYPSGELYIACDPIDRNLEIAGDGVFGFELPQGTTSEQATDIANFMNANLICMTYSIF
jgi:hypothetical protein